MEALSRFFQTKSFLLNSSSKGSKNTQKNGTRDNFGPDDVRLVVFWDHDLKGRSLIFDSKVIHRIGDGQGSCRRKSKDSGICTSASSTGQPPPEGAKHTPMRQLSDTNMIGEMMFGAVAMAYKGSTLKIHTIRSPPQVIITKIFVPVKQTKDSANTGDSESFDNSSYQSTSSIYTCENSTPRDMSSGSSGPHSAPNMSQSVPMAVPSSPPTRSLEELPAADTGDSGIAGSVTSSYSSHTTPYPSPGSSCSTGSNSYLHRRFTRSQNTSLELHVRTKLSDDALEKPLPASKRPPQYGIGIVFSMPEAQQDKNRHFQSFLFSHIMLIEGHVNKLRLALEKALKVKGFHLATLEGLDVFRQSVFDLYQAQRLNDPVWLSMMSGNLQKVTLCKTFLKEFMIAYDKYNTKSTKMFLSTLITAVLRHHLAWVPTVAPAGGTPSRTYLDKHSAKWLDALAKSHPYNPLWAQLGDLYGAIGFPLRLSRTIVIGKKQDVIKRFLYILSYFIRCSEVYETLDHVDEWHLDSLDDTDQQRRSSEISIPQCIADSKEGSMKSPSSVPGLFHHHHHASFTSCSNCGSVIENPNHRVSRQPDYNGTQSPGSQHHHQRKNSFHRIKSPSPVFESGLESKLEFDRTRVKAYYKYKNRPMVTKANCSPAANGVCNFDSSKISGEIGDKLLDSDKESLTTENKTRLLKCSNDGKNRSSADFLHLCGENMIRNSVKMEVNSETFITNRESVITNPENMDGNGENKDISNAISQGIENSDTSCEITCPLVKSVDLNCDMDRSQKSGAQVFMDSLNSESDSQKTESDMCSLCINTAESVLRSKAAMFFRQFEFGKTLDTPAEPKTSPNIDYGIDDQIKTGDKNYKSCDESAKSASFDEIYLESDLEKTLTNEENVEMKQVIHGCRGNGTNWDRNLLKTAKTNKIGHYCDRINSEVDGKRVNNKTELRKSSQTAEYSEIVHPCRNNSGTKESNETQTNKQLSKCDESNNDSISIIESNKVTDSFDDSAFTGPHSSHILLDQSRGDHRRICSDTCLPSSTCSGTGTLYPDITLIMSDSEVLANHTPDPYTGRLMAGDPVMDITRAGLYPNLKPLKKQEGLATPDQPPSQLFPTTGDVEGDNTRNSGCVSVNTRNSGSVSDNTRNSSSVSDNTRNSSSVSDNGKVNCQILDRDSGVNVNALNEPNGFTCHELGHNEHLPSTKEVTLHRVQLGSRCETEHGQQLYDYSVSKQPETDTEQHDHSITDENRHSIYKKDVDFRMDSFSEGRRCQLSPILEPVENVKVEPERFVGKGIVPERKDAQILEEGKFHNVLINKAEERKSIGIKHRDSGLGADELLCSGFRSPEQNTGERMELSLVENKSSDPSIVRLQGTSSTRSSNQVDSGIFDNSSYEGYTEISLERGSNSKEPQINTLRKTVRSSKPLERSISVESQSSSFAEMYSSVACPDLQELVVLMKCVQEEKTMSSVKPPFKRMASGASDFNEYFSDDQNTAGKDNNGETKLDKIIVYDLVNNSNNSTEYTTNSNDQNAAVSESSPKILSSSSTNGSIVGFPVTTGNNMMSYTCHQQQDSSCLLPQEIDKTILLDRIEPQPAEESDCSEQANLLTLSSSSHGSDDLEHSLNRDRYRPSDEGVGHCSTSMTGSDMTDREGSMCSECTLRTERSSSFSVARHRRAQYRRTASMPSTGTPGRCRSVTPTELSRRRHASALSINTLEASDILETASVQTTLSLEHITMPRSESKEIKEQVVPQERNFGHSLLAGYSPHYLSDFTLHGTSDTSFHTRLHQDLMMSVQKPVLDEHITETACVVADTDKWSVKSLSCHYNDSDRVQTQEVVASKLVSDIIDSVYNLWKLKMSPEFCLMHLEDRLQEVYFKSKMLSEYMKLHRKMDLKELAAMLGFDPSDLPLLLAVAGTHTPALVLGLIA